MIFILQVIFLFDSEVEGRTCTTVLSDGELLIPPTDKDQNLNYTSSHSSMKFQGSQAALGNVQGFLNGTHSGQGEGCLSYVGALMIFTS